MNALEKNRYLVEVHQIVVQYFSEEEVKTLYFQLCLLSKKRRLLASNNKR